MKIAITAIGTANPTNRRNQNDIAHLICEGLQLKPAQRRLLKSIYNATGIEHRYSVLDDYNRSPGDFIFFPNNPDAPYPTTTARMKLYKDNALNLSIEAIKNCLSQFNQFNVKNITHLITISCTGMYAPGIDIEIVQQLNLNSTTKRTAINFMGCYGAFNGIKVAEAICKADEHAKVLVVAVELCTIHFQKKMNLDNIISNAIFADGAACVLIEANPKQHKYLSLEKFYCDLLPQTQQEMAWHITDSGFDIVLSSYVPDVIQNGIKKFVERLLGSHQLTQEQINIYAIHPGGLKILQACEEALNITENDNKYSYEILRKFGNMSSATILFVLKAIWDDLDSHHHQKNIFSCAFGPGLTLEAMILKSHFK